MLLLSKFASSDCVYCTLYKRACGLSRCNYLCDGHIVFAPEEQLNTLSKRNDRKTKTSGTPTFGTRRFLRELNNFFFTKGSLSAL